MSANIGKNDYGGDSEDVLLAVNPYYGILGDKSAAIIESGLEYGGKTYRADNTDRIDNSDKFYSNIESKEENWHDENFMFDNQGFDRVGRNTLREADSIELIGGPLEDIGTVVHSIGESQNYSINKELTFDYAALNEDQGYVSDDLISIQSILDYSPETMDERLRRSALDDSGILDQE
jgi:hypothetical protein